MEVGRLLKRIHHWMYETRIGFRVSVWLEELGLVQRINYLSSKGFERGEDQKTTSRQFYDVNRERILRVQGLFEDEKSRQIYDSVWQYRMYGKPLKRGYSLHDQYFPKDIIHINDGEVFVDGGAYVGNTAQILLDRSKGKKVKIFSFEPDERVYRLLCNNLRRYKNVKIYNKGLSDKDNTLYFKESESGSSKIVDKEIDSSYKIEVTSIDGIPECNKVSFIKMDIEGAEIDALRGAEITIRKNKPKLAICIYHSDEDMVRVAEWIHEVVPEYKLYVRHHTRLETETVLYAIN